MDRFAWMACVLAACLIVAGCGGQGDDASSPPPAGSSSPSGVDSDDQAPAGAASAGAETGSATDAGEEGETLNPRVGQAVGKALWRAFGGGSDEDAGQAAPPSGP